MSNGRVCRYFGTTEGCKYGDKCRFSHVAESASSPKSPSSPASPKAGFSSGVRSIAIASTSAANNRRPTIHDAASTFKKQIPCQFYLQGHCNKGNQCQWSHEYKTQEDVVKKEAEKTIQRIVLGESTLVTCGAGMQVQHIVCGFDSCYITVKNLPQDAGRAEIEELFIQQGVDATQFHVFKIRTLNSKVEAKVFVDAEIGETLAVGLDGIPFKNEILDTAVDHDTGPSKMGSSARNVNVLTVSWKQPPFLLDSKAVEGGLRRIVEGIVGFQTYEVSPANLNRVNTEVRIRFDSWEIAKRAHDRLLQPRPGYPKFFLRLPKPIEYFIKIPIAQYRAQQARWDSLSEQGDRKMAHVTIKENADHASIRVLGEDKKTVGQLKVRVESLVAGETLDASLWHRSFLSRPGQQILDNISTRSETFIRCDWKTKSLKLYADGRAKEKALNLLKERVKKLNESEFSIPINRGAVRFFTRKGLAVLRDELGDDAVTLELMPSPRLVIRGGEEAHLIVDRLIQESRTSYQLHAKNAEDMCPVCFDEPSSPIRLGCKHIYCTECIRHFLLTASERKQFPLVCAGDDDQCKVPIAIPKIQQFLSPQQFNELLEAAVASYVEKQPDKFRYCTTADCQQVYRRGTKANTCPSCLASICTKCDKEAHEGMTCAERELLDNPAEQERLNEQWALTAGAKRCPSCRVYVQKTEGCNHMTCRCGVHFCWICSEVSDPNSIYLHMNTEHGGIHTADIPQPIQAIQQHPQPVRTYQQLAANQQIRATQPVRVDEQIRADLEYARRLQQEEILRGRHADLGNLGRLQQAIGQEGPVREAMRRIQARRDAEEAIQRRRAEEHRAAEAQQLAWRQAEERRAAEAQQHPREERGSWCIIM
ncbi:hypothetical protein F5887DRAFT_514967 [Amanita rubescens]|nr:hypothetical protein F5887DRAFT_514967 [Amanita rubescens]